MKNEMKMIHTRVTAEIKQDFEEECRDRGITPSLVIRKLIENWLKTDEPKLEI